MKEKFGANIPPHLDTILTREVIDKEVQRRARGITFSKRESFEKNWFFAYIAGSLWITLESTGQYLLMRESQGKVE
ncbi:MAG: hypothetical protein SVW57_07695 [Thermodesulfobacteriota bacterium]|nr:hypothetical protein [Thermodesulfobacteriota bacterium]